MTIPSLQKVKIRDLPIVIGDGNYSSKYPKASDFVSEGVPFISNKDIKDGKILGDELRYISPKQHAELKKGHLKEGDIIISTRANIGNVAWVRKNFENANINAQLVFLRTDEKVLHNRFVYFLLSGQKYKLIFESFSGGSAQAQLPIRDLVELPIEFPNYTTQVNIASILSTYDNLIDNNEKRIEILEETNQLLYREWFVEFRFSGYEKIKLIDSKLGKIPEAWTIKSIKDVLNNYIGGGWGNEEKNNEFDIPAYVIRGTDLPRAKQGDFSECPLRYHKKSNFKSRQLQSGDIIFEVSGGSDGQPLGRTLFINEELLNSFSEPVICASFCKLIRSNNILSSEYLFYTLNQWYKTGFLGVYEVQSTGISNYQFEAFVKNALVLLPDEITLREFTKFTKMIFKEIQLLGKTNSMLKEARDILLPKLISGEIDVSNLDIKN